MSEMVARKMGYGIENGGGADHGFGERDENGFRRSGGVVVMSWDVVVVEDSVGGGQRFGGGRCRDRATFH